MRLKEVYDPYAHVVRILEQKEQEVTILILTKEEEARGPTAKAIQDHCDKKGVSCFNIFSDEAFTFDKVETDIQIVRYSLFHIAVDIDFLDILDAFQEAITQDPFDERPGNLFLRRIRP